MNNKKSLIRSLIIITAVSFMAGVQIGTAKESGSKSQLGGGGLYKATGSPRATLVNINQMSVWTRADGFSSRNPMTGNSGVVYPRGTAGVIFADGILWGGLVKDGQSPELRAGGATYISGTLEGAIISKGVQESVTAADVRIWRIRDDWQTADLRQDASEFFDIAISSVSDGQIATVRAQYGTDWIEWPWQKGAPYYDDNGDGVYDPVNDRPGIADADQVVWFVRNDLSVGAVTGFLGSPPVGLEIQETLWGYARTDALGNMIFKKVVIIYKGTSDTPDGTGLLPAATIEELFLTQWSDPDLGDFGDDFAGSVPSLSLGYVYNSSSIDVAFRDFGLPPPAAGYDFFQGPIVDAPGETAIFNLQVVQDKMNLPMSSFVFFAAGSAISDPPLGSYEGTTQWYNLMHGLQPATGNPFVDPTTLLPTVFTLSGDPKTGEGWVDGNPLGPGDRRFLLTAGPFTMAFQDTQELVISLIAALGADRISSIDVLKFYDITAQNAFDNLFDLPTPPQAPAATAAGLDQTIVLVWGSNVAAVKTTEGQDAKGYLFEGYNVYQLPTQTATLSDAVKIASFDVPNEVTTILDPQFDPTSGQILNLPSQIGKNSGILRNLEIKTDAFTGGEIVNFREYYFAVTAYNNNSSVDVPVHSLESSPIIITVIPQPPNTGERYAFLSGDSVTVEHEGTSDGAVIAIVYDPSELNGQEYTITFSDTFTWNLDVGATRVITAGTNQSGDDDYPLIEGVTVKVIGPPPGMKDWDIPNGTRRFTWAGADFDFEGFNGAIGWGTPSWAFGSGVQGVTAPNLTNVLIKLATATDTGDLTPPTFDTSQENVSFAYRYGRNFSSPPQQAQFAPFILNTATGGYTYQNFEKSVPLSAWDMESDPPRRLAVGHMENNQPVDADNGGGMVDGVYWPGASSSAVNNSSDGPREWLWIFNTDYSETPNPAFQVEAIGGEFPIMWWLTVNRRGSGVSFADGDEFLILANHVNSSGDVFTFTPAAPSVTAASEAEDFNSINVFPNPYLGVNSLETTRTSRWVRFTHLPREATIRIFNLAGIHVATVNKNDNLQFVDWNLNNWNDLPVASGVYLAHVTLPASGFEKILKIMVVQEQQFLQNF